MRQVFTDRTGTQRERQIGREGEKEKKKPVLDEMRSEHLQSQNPG